MKSFYRDRRGLAWTVAAACVFAAGCTTSMHETTGDSGVPTSAMGAAPNALNSVDRSFATMAAASGLYEVEASRVAMVRAGNPQVHSYAAMLVQHHTMANSELMALLRAHAMSPPSALPPDKRAKLDSLAAMPAADFDKQFVQMVGVEDHQRDIELFERGASAVSDNGLKTWITKTLPTLRSHLSAAEGLVATMNA
jgi:putative membrane protein